MRKIIAYLGVSFMLLTACAPQPETTESLQSLSTQFKEPPSAYHPYVWWHWMGSNFSKEGITKDLEAMKEAGIGGAAIFNIASSVQNTHEPIENNPWPEQTFRGEAYWDALVYAASEAKRLGLKLGLHATPGYATTGGPWIKEEQGMQKLVFSKANTTGNRLVELSLEKPELPVYEGYGSSHKRATYYRDVAVMAVPNNPQVTVDKVLNISEYMDTTGLLRWQAPKGSWTIYRVGHAPTMANPHPLPDDIIGKSLEVDKMSREHNVYHWQQVLEPLKARLKDYIGDSFTFIWVDSYEAEDQNWTPLFREEFVRLKGYDPLPWIALREFSATREDLKDFKKDFKEVVNRLFIDNGWQVAAEMIHEAGLKFYWEPYYGPFDTYECVSIPDVPVEEFWTTDDGRIGPRIPTAARAFGKRILAAEAYTGDPSLSKYTEDPAFLKPSTDGAFVSGINWLFLHHWVHQPFDDRYQPGMGMGWWGTHFGRNQTWIKPGKAFFTYLARCQMLLQQGELVSYNHDVLHRHTADADIFFVTNSLKTALTKVFSFPVKTGTPELWNADKGTIYEVRDQTVQGDSTYVTLTLNPDASIFVVFPQAQTKYAKLPVLKVIDEVAQPIAGPWNVTFQPKLAQPFTLEVDTLFDFSTNADEAVKYFAGTAVYEKTISVDAEALGKNAQVVIDLGALHDIAELKVNGKDAGVLWYPPYRTEITPWLKAGDNVLSVAVTTNWANRLIGDEQYPADFEWGTDRGVEMGRAMKAFPDWFIKKQPRPEQHRKAFNLWYYYRQDSPLQPAGLLGPVQLIRQTTEI